MCIVHLAASPFFGGPERQMLGLARHLPDGYRSVFLSFRERGLAEPFLGQLRNAGFEAITLENNAPHVWLCVNEVAGHLRRVSADILCCHGYKPDLIGLLAARRVGIPVVVVSHGWTAATAKVRIYEAIDRRVHRWANRVVCVSEGQAVKVRRAGVREERIRVIRNAVEAERFANPDPAYCQHLRNYFSVLPERVVCSVGRFSPEKGFGQLVEAAAMVVRERPDTGFVHFGDGPLQGDLEKQIQRLNLGGRFVLAGFRKDIDKFIPHTDLMVLPSFTEGLPNVALEALAAGVPVVATAVGGTPEVVEEGVCGYLVPPGDPAALARRIVDALADEARRAEMGRRGRARIHEQFTFESHSRQYQAMFNEFWPKADSGVTKTPSVSIRTPNP